MRNCLLYINTLRYLKWIQIYYRVLYSCKKRFRLKQRFQLKSVPVDLKIPLLKPFPPSNVSLRGTTFTFLNREYSFESIDWDFQGYGKLWTYNLNYFEFLHQPGMNAETGLKLIRDYISKQSPRSTGQQSYPSSLRIINWIKFISVHGIQDSLINAFLWNNLQHLSMNPEYHLLGNHILENGIALLWGALWYQDSQWLKQAEGILKRELEEQILPDGAHFELSPMYHQIILHRLIDTWNLLTSNPTYGTSLQVFLQPYLIRMIHWIKQMTFANGDIPLFNDAANGIAPDTRTLLGYASILGIAIQNDTIEPLRESGYHRFNSDRYEMILDTGPIGPDYNPGHGHCDMFSFVLYHQGIPLIVDTGTSTYERNVRRLEERKTAAHNTVGIDGMEQSDVWGSHRVDVGHGSKWKMCMHLESVHLMTVLNEKELLINGISVLLLIKL